METFSKYFIPTIATIFAFYILFTQGSIVGAIIIWYLISFILRLPIFGALGLLLCAEY